MDLVNRRTVGACVVFAVVTYPAMASHDSASKILGKWAAYQSRMHVLNPAETVRSLPIGQDKKLADGISSAAQNILRNGMGVVVIDHGNLLFEGYDNEADRESKMDAYSMTKSLTALAVGEALCAGKINSLEDSAAKYVPQLEGTAYGSAKIQQLLSYTSGAQDPGGNGYMGIHNMSDFRAMAGHTMSLMDLMKKYGNAQFEPGKKFIYNGLDSDTLSIVVRNATGKSLPQWFEATVWKKAGAEFQAGWYLDRDGNGVGEVGFYATTRDFARVGLYIADRLSGISPDKCMNDFVNEASRPQIHKGYWNAAPSFGLGLHIGADGKTWMFGHGSQRVGIDIKKGRVVAINGWKDWPVDDPAQSLLGY